MNGETSDSLTERSSLSFTYRKGDVNETFEGETTPIGSGPHGEVRKAVIGDSQAALKIFQKKHVGNLSSTPTNSIQHSVSGGTLDLGDMSEEIWDDLSSFVGYQHPNIVQVLATSPYQGHRKVMVTELLERNLETHLERNSKMSIFDRLRLMHDAAVGLEALHTRSTPIIHGNLKPQNCLITKSGVLKIGDFGVPALAAHLSPLDATVSQVLYCAPEVLESPILRSQSSDVWSLGLIFWNILTGLSLEREFGGPETGADFVEALCHSKARPRYLIDTMTILDCYDEESKDAWKSMIHNAQTVLDKILLAPDASTRPTSSELVLLVEKLILMELELLPEYARDLWAQFEAMKLVERFSIPLEAFFEVCSESLNESSIIKREDRLKILKCLPRIVSATEESQLTLANFSTFFHVYSTLECHNLSDTLRYFLECVSLPYFFGPLNSKEAQETERTLEPGTFFLRYSTYASPNNRLTVCYKSLGAPSNKISYAFVSKYDGSLDLTIDGDTCFAVRLSRLIKASMPHNLKPTSISSPFSLLLQQP